MNKKFKFVFSLILIILVFNFFSIASSVDVNDTTEYITFGKYEQDNNKDNGKEDIEWRVLDRQNGCLLLISKYILDIQPFNVSHTYVTWASSTLKRFLNNTFLNQSFTAAEQGRIVEITHENMNNPKFGISGGAKTKDKIFVLSYDEAEKYFGPNGNDLTNKNAIALGTEYAKARGLFVNYSGLWCHGFSPYWLRTPGSYLTSAMTITESGEALYIGDGVQFFYGVRPVMWILE